MKTVAIEEAFEFVRNGLSVKQEDGKTGIPITRIETIWNSNIDKDRFGFADITEEKLKDIERYLLKEGDILMTHINSPKHLGKCAIYNNEPEKLIHGMNLLCLRPKGELLLPKYALYFFNSGKFKTVISRISNQSVNQASFSAGNLKDIEIPLPPLDTQKKIAAILDAADAYRQKTKTLIEKYDQLAQSLFLDMFGDPVTNEKGFPKTILKELIIDVKNGISRRRKVEENTGDIVLRLRDIRNNNIDFSEVNRILLTKEEKKKYQIKISDLLFIRVNGNPEYVGRCAVFLGFNESVYFNDHIMRVRIKDDNNSIFLSHFLNSSFGKNQIAMYRKTSAGQHTINQFGLEKIDLYKPPFYLQNQFAERIQLIEAQKQQAQASLQKAEDLFNSLLQRAFNGKLVS